LTAVPVIVAVAARARVLASELGAHRSTPTRVRDELHVTVQVPLRRHRSTPQVFAIGLKFAACEAREHTVHERVAVTTASATEVGDHEVERSPLVSLRTVFANAWVAGAKPSATERHCP
jgi:hypothetical protein